MSEALHDELKHLGDEMQELLEGLAAEMEKADESAAAMERLEAEISGSDAEFQSFVDEMTGEIDALAQDH